MIPWVLLDAVRSSGGGEDLRLLRRGDEFSIRVGRAELMNSRLSGSEEALATLAAARLAGRARPEVLIGGYGMGFTLRAALRAFPREARITVAELAPAVVAWARGPMAAMTGDCLDDPRVAIVEDDVARLIRDRRAGWDAILLDVDNGPEAMTSAANDGLYGAEGLAVAHAALKPGGVLAVWSAVPDRAFAKRFGMAGFTVEDERVRAHAGKSGARHVIWLGTKTPARSAPRPGGASRRPVPRGGSPKPKR